MGIHNDLFQIEFYKTDEVYQKLNLELIEEEKELLCNSYGMQGMRPAFASIYKGACNARKIQVNANTIWQLH